jgi:imidazolonepropionase-like amidohydrolase
MRVKALLSAALVALAAPAVAQTVAITNVRLSSGAGDAVDGATVVVRDGRIAAAGQGVAVPAGAQVVDGSGKWVTPGIFGGFTRLGLIEVDSIGDTEDSEADASPFSAAIDVAPAINPNSVNLDINRIDGVTRAVVAPNVGRTIFAGQGAIIQLGEGDPVVRPRAFQYAELGERGANVAGGSRAASFTAFRAVMREALAYATRRGAYAPGATRDAVFNEVDVAALVPVVRGQTKLLVRAERANDLTRILELKREFPNLDLVLVGALSKVPGAVGLTHAQALATITSAPAEIFGLTDVGMLGAGKRADVVLWDGDPLELSSAPTMVMIDGRPVPLDSRQTKLRDRYHPSKDRTKLPLHYQR